MPDDNAPKYDPQRHVLVRDWCWHHDQDIAQVLGYLHKQGVAITWVQNPYAEALSHSFLGGGNVSECYSPTVRAISVADREVLDAFQRLYGPRPITRDLRVTFKEISPGHYGVHYDDPGMGAGTWYIERPAELKPENSQELAEKGSTQVGADSFNFPPCIELDVAQRLVTIYGLIRITDGPITINGVACYFHEAHDSPRSKLPGGWRYGKYDAGVTEADVQELKGEAV